MGPVDFGIILNCVLTLVVGLGDEEDGVTGGIVGDSWSLGWLVAMGVIGTRGVSGKLGFDGVEVG